MQYFVKSSKPENIRTDCAIVPWFEDSGLDSRFKQLDQACGKVLNAAKKRGDISGRAGQVVLLPVATGAPARRILVIGCGKKERYNRKTLRKAVTAATSALLQTAARSACALLPAGDDNQEALSLDMVAAVEDAVYRFDSLKSKKLKAEKIRLTRFVIACEDAGARNAAKRTLEQARAVAEGARLARDLGNMPSNLCTPRYLASIGRKIAGRSKKATASVLTPAQMKRLGMGALLSVTAGATEPARLIVIQYRGAASKQAPVVLVGKGITFDTGGISLKPGAGMDEMKFDMCGAAGVLGTMQAVIDLGIRKNVVALVPACVNMPDGKATNPGDIVTTMSGQTVEILNTDAEGRLILCDALTYARRFKPATVIDVATLTGACVVALGPHLSGLMSEDEALAEELMQAGRAAGDEAWRLPLSDEYGEGLKSNFADFANVAGREGGASIAASYLSRFTDGLRWAHLDIAGTAWKSGKDKGATGRPVGLLTQYLLNA